MKENILFSGKTLFMKIALLAALIVGGGNSAWGDELIKCDSTVTNTALPIQGGYLNNHYVKSEFILLSGELTAIHNKRITQLTFYSNSASKEWENAQFKVFMEEVSTSSIAYNGSGYSYIDTEKAQTVYTGSLSVNSDKEMVVTFSNPFTYSGEKHLLIGIECITKGTKNSVAFYGAANYSYYRGIIGNASTGDPSSPTRAAFRPKTKFTYTSALPSLSVSPIIYDFGSVSSTTVSESFTVSNTGGGSLDVNFTNTNTDDFSVLNSSDEVITSLSNIENGSPQTFKIRFNYNSESLGNKSATIKVIPTYNENDSVKIVASATARSNNDPELSVSPNEDFDFGTVTANASKTYTVTNTGTGTMNVTIASSNTDYFTLTSDDFTENTTTIEGIAAGGSAEFTVNFRYTCAIANFGDHSSTITVTPSYDSDAAVSWDVSANASANVVLDETQATTWTSGSGKSVWVKYQPQNGWNTIILPFPTSTNLASIFGSGAVAYQLNSFSDEGVLSFSKTDPKTYIGANVPCLVYIENAPDNSSGVLLTGIYVFQASNATPGNVSKSNSNSETATFKGTFAPIAAPGMEGKYGVTTAGKLGKGSSLASIKGYRAYIEVSESLSRLSLLIEDDGETPTDLDFVRLIDKDAKDVYNLQGQKVKKSGKGIYVVNGKKVIVK